MQLISLKVENIRTYKHAKVEFPTGIVMLSGDIGSGKSTILLAIEFALFGLLRGELSGNALLRTGEREGNVELKFQVNKKQYLIKRSLKRTKKSVEQNSGYLIVDDVKKEGTATELKSWILEILGYPPELLTKGKNFVYRYTVYTPQEEMKRILLESKEDRVGILRKVFNIDKYEKISQNASSYAKALRERKRAFDVLIADMQEKKKQKEDLEKEHSLAGKKSEEVKPRLEEVQKKLKEVNEQVLILESQQRELEKLNRELQVAKTTLRGKEQQSKQILEDLGTVSAQLIEAQKNLPNQVEVSLVLKRKEDTHKQILEKEKHIREMSMKSAELLTLKKQSDEHTTKINGLMKCPTCLQEVQDEHKHSVIHSETQKKKAIELKLGKSKEILSEAETSLVELKKNLQDIQQQEKQIAIANVKIKHAEQLEQRKVQLDGQKQTLMLEIDLAGQQIGNIERQLKPLQETSTGYEVLRKQKEEVQQEERKLSIEYSTASQRVEILKQNLERLKEDLEKKENAKKLLERTQHVHQWVADYFIPLMDVIEKHVMATVHHEFDAIFQDWFGTLVEDVLTSRLDETFTPIVQQNGHELEVGFLSGGEKTACALAYRLALNKTINSLISTIQTKDLIVLDEPTDGFSTEQLDKMRDVLDQLGLKQVIIVSHEQKIESFADHVIRIDKREGESLVC